MQVGALVVSDSDSHADADLDLATLVSAVRGRLSAFKVPTVWHVVPDLDAVPRSPTGKVDKAQLQELLRKHGLPPPTNRSEPRQ